ncbi:MAG: ABC transporter substrate-binding protein [Actinomycetota bacterium]|nr:ABC transporter substrate-binding protein [Actinomycetota bacterium]
MYFVVAVVAVSVISFTACTSSTTQPVTKTPQEITSAQTAGADETPDTQVITWPVVIDTEQLPIINFTTPSFEGGERILALAVGSGEIVDLLGAGTQLVGKDETSSTSQEVPVVTQGHQIDIEQALSIKPTLVLVDDLTGPPEAIDALAGSGARIVNVPPVWSLNDVEARVSAIAKVIGAPAESAQGLSAALTGATDATDAQPPRVAFLYLRGPSAIYLLGGANTGADALIEATGGVDVGAELGYDGFVPLTAEAIVEAAPDVLLVMSDGLESVGGIDGLLDLPGVAQTRAGDKRRVVVVDDQVLLSFGARTPALIDRLAKVFAKASE